MNKPSTQNDKPSLREWKLMAVLSFVATVMMLSTACSNNNNSVPASNEVEPSDGLRHAKDSTALDLRSSSSEATDLPQLSVFDRLESNMVFVENDTGGFYICKHEVTQALWVAVMGENPSQMQGNDLPVEQVNWDDCQVFIGRLNKLTGKHFRLPTEAEWEYACRGGKYSKGYKYSGSNDIDEVAWYDGNSENRTHPVGQKRPNELGLYDMSGNVWEWCGDMQELEGMCRGGSWIHNARNCDPSLPNETPRMFKINCLGLRLAL